jgi:4-aminobutyrate aminotransferase-like enzyme/aminoglycoside phosphotransferase (APT) family kinase protein
MNFLKIVQPRFERSELERIAREDFGLEGEWTSLPSERDQSFHIELFSGESVTFKVANADEPPDIIDCEIAALQHIARSDPSLPVPRVVMTRKGKPTAAIRDARARTHLVRVLSYLEGEIVAERRLTTQQLESIGRLVARLGKALRGFIHPAPAARDLLWDNRLAPKLLDHAHLIANAADRKLAADVLERFRDETLPRLAMLRAQIIHGDAHPCNVLVDERGWPAGIIDFGDLVHSVLIQDVANMIADFLESTDAIDDIIFPLVKGYREVTALEEDELDLVLPLIEVRLVMTAIIGHVRASNGTAPMSYLTDLTPRSLPRLRDLMSRRPEIANLIRRAGAFPPARSADPPSVPELVARRRNNMGDKLYLFYDPPLHLVRGDSVWLMDAGGRRYLDCYNNVPHVGHCHPYVSEAIARQARRLNTNTRYVTDESVEYAERLAATAAAGLTAVTFVNSGSEANDVAWRMAKVWTRRRGGLCMEFAYHGITEASDAFSPSNAPNAQLKDFIRTLAPPDDYRGPYRRGEAKLAERYAALADSPINSLNETGLGVAAFMLDSAFMTNGMLEAPAGYVAQVVEKVRKAGGLFIADEVQSGFGRLGSDMWGHRHHGVVPDFITIGKPAGNGHPLGAVITRPEILSHFTGEAAFFSTFGGNNVSCAAGIAVLDVIRDENLIENAKETGAYLKQGLRNLMDRHAIIGDVRGTGLALGMELVLDRKTRAPASHTQITLLNLVRDEGVLVGGEGAAGNIIKIRPPIVFRREHADIAIAAIDRAVARL